MSFTIEFVNADECANRFGAMIGKLTRFGGLDIPHEMSDWQVADMHRKRPATKRGPWRHHTKSTSTLIRPHSRYEVLQSKAYQAGLRRRMRRRKRPLTGNIQVRRSTRPILRAQLLDQLVTRMTELFKAKIIWSK